MKKAILLAMAASALTMSGCAFMSTKLTGSAVSVTEVSSINHSQSTKIQSFGASNATILGPVFAKTDAKCSLGDVARSAKKKFQNVSDVVNVRMEELSEEKNGTTVYSCKASGLAVYYKNISPEEARIWRSLLSEKDVSAEEAPSSISSLIPTSGAVSEEETVEVVEEQ